MVLPKVCDALIYLHRQIVGLPMGTYCDPLIADLFLFCYERDFMMSLFSGTQADVIEAFKVVICGKYINLNKITII